MFFTQQSLGTAPISLAATEVLGLLEQLRQGKKIANPLFVTESRHEERWLAWRLISWITKALNRHRALYNLPVGLTTQPYDRTLSGLQTDYQQGNAELEAWSLLYHRYVRVDLDWTMEQMGSWLRMPVRTLQRRRQLGAQRLSDKLMLRLLRHQRQVRVAQLKAQLPAVPPSLLAERAPLLSQVITHLSAPNEPLLLYGGPGVRKTALGVGAATALIETGALRQLIWIRDASASAHLLADIAIGLGPTDVAQLPIYLHEIPTLLVLDGADGLLDTPILDALLSTLSGAHLLLCARYCPIDSSRLYPLRVSPLSQEGAFILLENWLKTNDCNALAHIERLWHTCGGYPGVLRAAVFAGPRHLTAELVERCYQPMWQVLSPAAQLVWQMLSINPACVDREDAAYLELERRQVVEPDGCLTPLASQFVQRQLAAEPV